MFAARGAGVSLAIFVLVYAICSLAVFIGWRLVLRAVKPVSARGAAGLLFTLRLFPLGFAFLVMVGVALPSFLLLEPRGTDEAVGAAPTALAIGFLVIALLGVVRAVRAQRRTSLAMERWFEWVDSHRLARFYSGVSLQSPVADPDRGWRMRAQKSSSQRMRPPC